MTIFLCIKSLQKMCYIFYLHQSFFVTFFHIFFIENKTSGYIFCIFKILRFIRDQEKSEHRKNHCIQAINIILISTERCTDPRLCVVPWRGIPWPPLPLSASLPVPRTAWTRTVTPVALTTRRSPGRAGSASSRTVGGWCPRSCLGAATQSPAADYWHLSKKDHTNQGIVKLINVIYLKKISVQKPSQVEQQGSVSKPELTSHVKQGIFQSYIS